MFRQKLCHLQLINVQRVGSSVARQCALCSADNFHVLDHARLNRFPTQDKRGYSYSKRTTILESTITPCKSKTILYILTLSCFTYFLVVTIYHNQHCSTYQINSTSNFSNTIDNCVTKNGPNRQTNDKNGQTRLEFVLQVRCCV